MLNQQASRLERLLYEGLTVTNGMDELIIFDALKFDNDTIIEIAKNKLTETNNPMLLGVQVIRELLDDDESNFLKTIQSVNTERNNIDKAVVKSTRLTEFEYGMLGDIQGMLVNHHPDDKPSIREVGDSAAMVFCIMVTTLVLAKVNGIQGEATTDE